MEEIAVLIVDDEQGLRDMLTTVLKKEGFLQVKHAATGREALQVVMESHMDVIVLDVMLPDSDGFEVCRQMRLYTDAPILFLTARDTDLDKLMGFGIGGDDYITKPFNPLEVVARMKARMKYRKVSTVAMKPTLRTLDFGYFRLELESGVLYVEGKQVDCPAREWLLLVFLCKHPNRIFSVRQLYETIWSEAFLGDEKTVVIHISRLRKKIEPDPKHPQFLINVRGLGYKMMSVKMGEQE
ncbi:DNA-binding response regulator [Paenibacillus peoriae]|uniref:response regulator transcription factor n=1 Tax=Paenibacillus TaxID=44249 RepID=UPI000471FA19|nr:MULTISPECIES: response regulator transcription factor [Paenibacillus]OMF44802.1 DNA-binding response regulator [Paenibacillus peoriae]PPQ50813.1 DNA-binding response regulator [Paenibacillus peoriae]WCM62821.1 response regulator transcription factor [Paenibacillus polymyxa]